MKRLRNIFIATLVLFTAVSCEEQLDINTDPFAAAAAPSEVILPYVLVSWSNEHSAELGTRINDVHQHMSQNFNSPKQGGNTSQTLVGNTWGIYYANCMGNIGIMIDAATEIGPGQANVLAIATILRAQIFWELTSLWEDVPFTEATLPQEFQAPQFDSQETVLRGIIQLLDDANAVIATAPPSNEMLDLSVADLVYGGDLSLWERYANTLKLRVLMMIRNVDTSVDAQITATLSQPLIESNAQAAMITYGQSTDHAMYGIVDRFFAPSNETFPIHGPGDDLYNLLETTGDPRYDLFLVDPGGFPPGHGILPVSNPNSAHYSDNIIRPDYSHILGLPAEVSLYRAELAILGVVPGDQQALFNQGVTQAIEFWGNDIPGAQIPVAGADITAFLNSLPPVDLDAVYEQLYLESFLRPVLGWNHVRRTRVPNIPPAPGSNVTTMIKRFDHSEDERSSNPNTPVNKPIDEPMWFENL